MSGSPASRPWFVPVLAICTAAFAICTAELIVAGLLTALASDLGVDIPTAGLLITGYAIGVAVAGPGLALLTARIPHKTLLVSVMTVFALGNILCALAPSYWVLLGARLVIAGCHGLFFGIAVVMATELAPANRKATAVSLVSAGVASAVVAGVPIGTAVGNALGWRASFLVLAAVGLAAVLVIVALVPRARHAAPTETSATAEAAAALQLPVLLGYAIIASTILGMLALLSYIVPVLTEASGIPLDYVPVVIAGMGVMGFFGSLAGGRLGDWNGTATLIGAFAASATLFFLLGQVIASPWAAALLLCVCWFAAFIFGPVAQSRILRDASRAPMLASTLVSTAYQVGIASGAAVGGAAISAGFGYAQLPIIASLCNGVALLLTLWLALYDRRASAVIA